MKHKQIVKHQTKLETLDINVSKSNQTNPKQNNILPLLLVILEFLLTCNQIIHVIVSLELLPYLNHINYSKISPIY